MSTRVEFIKESENGLFKEALVTALEETELTYLEVGGKKGTWFRWDFQALKLAIGDSVHFTIDWRKRNK
jgi:hypothetical protein